MTSSCQETPPDEQYPNLTTSLPELSSYPEDIEGRRALNQTLAGRCLNFPNKMSGSKVIRSTINYVMDDPGDTLDLEAARRSLEAWSLACELQEKYGLGGAEPLWDYAKGLAETIAHVESTKLKSAMAQAELMRGFLPPETSNK
jgi:hypothetical protein